MGIVQSNLNTKGQQRMRLNYQKEEKSPENKMTENSIKNFKTGNLNNSFRTFTKTKITFKSKNFYTENPEKSELKKIKGNEDKPILKKTEEYNKKEIKNDADNIRLVWTPSSDFDKDLVSSFERTEPVKSISYERILNAQRMSFERLNPLSRLGSDFVTKLQKSISFQAAECQDCNEERVGTSKLMDNTSRLFLGHDKEGKMDIDQERSKTKSTDTSEERSPSKTPVLKKHGDDTSNVTTYVSTTATTNPNDILGENEKSSSPERSPKLMEVDKKQNYQTPRRVYEKEHEHVHGKDSDNEPTCIPSCFRMLGKGERESGEIPSFNSLCTKCMHKADKLPRGFKGMILQLPSHKSTNKPQDKSPYLNRSNIVLQTTLDEGKRIEDVYELNKDKLGKGSYGNVVKGVHKKTGAVRAVKIIRKSKIQNAMRMKREIQIMKTLDHPSIIKLYEVYEDVEFLYLVMEMCTGGELFDRIVSKGTFSETYAAFIMKQIFSAIAYCHAKNVLHRDLKPENILYTNNTTSSNIKIIDWGFATKCYKSHKFTSLVGTPYYVAPEVLLGNYDKACDIWSAGVILFILLVGYPPFHGSDNAEILKNVKKGYIKFIPKHWSHVSRQAMDLITRCLSYIPKNRISAEDALNHEWILKCTTTPPTVAPSVSKTLARRFKTFLKYNKMKQMALTCIAYHLSENELGPLNSAFEQLDRDGDGMLSLSEVANALVPSNQPQNNIDQIVKGLDTDQSGAIEYTEFIAAAIDTRLYNQKDFCTRAFNIFDTDGDGKITRDDMMRVFAGDSTSVKLTHEMVDDILNEVDLDKDGKISYKEFYLMLYGWPDSDKKLRA